MHANKLSTAHYDARGNGLALGDTVISNSMPTMGRAGVIEKIAPSGMLTVRLVITGRAVRLHRTSVTLYETA